MKTFSLVKRFGLISSALTLMGVGLISNIAYAGSPSSQTSAGQFTGGNILYIKDETQNGKWGNTIGGVNQCDTLEYKIYLYNPGPSFLANVQAQVWLPSATGTSNTAGVTLSSPNAFPQSVSANATASLTSAQSISYVSGSTQLLDQNNNLVTKLPDGITQGGVNVGQLNASQTEFISFLAKVSCPQPTYACTNLTIDSESDRTIKITGFATSQANGASFTNASINWGDNSQVLVTSQPIGQSHQYANYGTYTITATANFNVNNYTKSATSQSCTKQVSFTAPTPPPAAPTKPASTPNVTPPSKLVNTGPGDTIAAFIGASLVGFFSYLFLTKKKLASNR